MGMSVPVLVGMGCVCHSAAQCSGQVIPGQDI